MIKNSVGRIAVGIFLSATAISASTFTAPANAATPTNRPAPATATPTAKAHVSRDNAIRLYCLPGTFVEGRTDYLRPSRSTVDNCVMHFLTEGDVCPNWSPRPGDKRSPLMPDERGVCIVRLPLSAIDCDGGPESVFANVGGGTPCCMGPDGQEVTWWGDDWGQRPSC